MPDAGILLRLVVVEGTTCEIEHLILHTYRVLKRRRDERGVGLAGLVGAVADASVLCSNLSVHTKVEDLADSAVRAREREFLHLSGTLGALHA